MDESGPTCSTRPKRRKTVISLDKKLAAINRMFRGESIHSIAKSYGVGVSTAWDWKRNRERLQEWYRKTVHNTFENNRSSAHYRKTMKPSEYDLVDSALYTWYLEQKQLGIDRLTGAILQKKAMLISAELYGDDEGIDSSGSSRGKMADKRPKFSASSGWLNRWKRRHGIGRFTDNSVNNDKESNHCKKENQKELGEEENNPLLPSHEEQEMSILEIPQPITNLINTLITELNYKADEIYWVRQMSLNFNEMPANTVVRPPDKRFRNVAQKFTVFIGSNYSGTHKLPAMCIHKPAKPALAKLEAWCIENFVPKIEKVLEEKCGNNARDKISKKDGFSQTCADRKMDETARDRASAGKSGNSARSDIESDQVLDLKPFYASTVRLESNSVSTVQFTEKSGNNAHSLPKLHRNPQIEPTPSCVIPQNEGFFNKFDNPVSSQIDPLPSSFSASCVTPAKSSQIDPIPSSCTASCVTPAKFDNTVLGRIKMEQLDDDRDSDDVSRNEEFSGSFGNTALARVKIEQCDNHLDDYVVPESDDFPGKTGNTVPLKPRPIDEKQCPKSDVLENDEFLGKYGDTASNNTRLLDDNKNNNKTLNKAILLVDGDSDYQNMVKCGAQGQIAIVFVPRKNSKKFHAEKPLQEILNYLTFACRFAQLQFVLRSQQKGILLTGKMTKTNMVECLDEIGLGHALTWITQAWDKIDSCQIRQSWSKVLSKNVQKITVGNSLEVDKQAIYDLVSQVKGCQNVTQNDVDTWLSNCDSDVGSADEDEEFVDSNFDRNSGNSRFPDSPTSEVGCTIEVITHSNVLRSLERSLFYVKHQPGVTREDVEVFQKWRDYAAERST